MNVCQECISVIPQILAVPAYLTNVGHAFSWRGKGNMFLIPILDRFLLYAPLHNLIALLDRAAVLQLRANIRHGQAITAGPLRDIALALGNSNGLPPLPREGEFVPAFLGLLPTRGCNLACCYCGFAQEGTQQAMSLNLARNAIDWYLDIVSRAEEKHAEIHFFGGEPFCAPEVIDFAVHLGRARARQAGCSIRFEVATNGVFDEKRCRWIADNLDSVVLSLDGPPEIQGLHRPYKNPLDHSTERWWDRVMNIIKGQTYESHTSD